MVFQVLATLLGMVFLRVGLFAGLFALLSLALKLASITGSIWTMLLPTFILFLLSDYLLERRHLRRPLWGDYWWPHYRR